MGSGGWTRETTCHRHASRLVTDRKGAVLQSRVNTSEQGGGHATFIGFHCRASPRSECGYGYRAFKFRACLGVRRNREGREGQLTDEALKVQVEEALRLDSRLDWRFLKVTVTDRTAFLQGQVRTPEGTWTRHESRLFHFRDSCRGGSDSR